MNKPQKAILIYFPYAIGKPLSGSSVRPQRMVQAFMEFCAEHDIELIAIHGESQERESQLKQLQQQRPHGENILYAYMENATVPLWLTDPNHIPKKPRVDISILNYLKQNNVPLGIFYRDIYWKFPEYKLAGVKRAAMKTIYQIELSLYKKYASHFFLPSLPMNEYTKFQEDKVTALPPGGVDNLNLRSTDKSEDQPLNAIYVGGLSESYGIAEMLKAFDEVAQHDPISLQMICRETEYEKHELLQEYHKTRQWLKVNHASGEELAAYYQQADFAMLPLKRTVYNDFAVAVKLFEYMSYGLPVVATDCLAQAKIIQESGNGVTVPDHSEGLVRGIESMQEPQALAKYEENAKESLLQSNLWIHRVERVHDVMRGSASV